LNVGVKTQEWSDRPEAESWRGAVAATRAVRHE
jgi:hypothetical protein